MVKFVAILISVVSFNFYVSITTTDSQPQEVQIEFSDEAVAIESGQPVFKKGTKVWVSNPQKEEIKLYLNEAEKEVKDDKIDLSQITSLKEGTYTLVINTNTEEKVFGFTIQ
ncbi:MAG: hypothetical protein RLN88_06830 [Ekhidna sp.]|uniref:hypothetical protein n=1 Tax=Ekhidna sp. TaxID=2608089 RepID=UPI0032EB8361